MKEPLSCPCLLLLKTGGTLGKRFCSLTSFGAGDVDYCCFWLSARKDSLDFDFDDNDLTTVSSNFGPNNIFEFDSSMKAYEFSLLIYPTSFLSFTNIMKLLNL